MKVPLPGTRTSSFVVVGGGMAGSPALRAAPFTQPSCACSQLCSGPSEQRGFQPSASVSHSDFSCEGRLVARKVPPSLWSGEGSRGGLRGMTCLSSGRKAGGDGGRGTKLGARWGHQPGVLPWSSVTGPGVHSGSFFNDRHCT